MKATDADWRKLQGVLILLLVFTFCLYLPSVFHEAFADDELYLAYANRFLRAAHWSELYQIFLRPANPIEFLPLRDFTYWLDFRLYGDEPSGFHVTNLAWYAACSLSAFWLFRELILLCRPEWKARASVLSLCGALLFVAHPAHVEVAAWIASRKDLVAGTLGFLSFATLARALRHNWPLREILLAALLLGAACFGKASAMTGVLFVSALIGMEWQRHPDITRAKKLGGLLVFWAVVGVAFLIHLNVGAETGIRIDNHPGLLTMLDRASRIFSTLIGMLFFPYPLRFYHDVYQLGDWHWLVSAGAAVAFLVSLRVLARGRSLWALGVVLMLSPLAVYLQLMPFTTWSLASERFVFVPVAGLALVLIDLLGRMRRPVKVVGLMLAIVLPCAAIVWSRVAEWGDSPHLLSREYQMQPGFHNAMRDHIVFTLLPEKRYVEAAALARQLPRPYAVEALLGLVNAEQAQRQMDEAGANTAADAKAMLQQNFCRAVAQLRAAAEDGYAQIPAEPDVSYNNILRTVDKQLKFRYSGAAIICAGRAVLPN